MAVSSVNHKLGGGAVTPALSDIDSAAAPIDPEEDVIDPTARPFDALCA